MKLFWHLLRTDLRRFRLMIGAWIAIAVAGVVLYAASPGMAGDMRLFGTVQTTAGLLWLARQILTIALVPFIVHAHPAVGSTAFWMTRPITPRLLLASKVLLIFGVTVGVPVAGDLALAIALHVPARETFLAAVQVGLANGLWVALLMTLAVLTRTFAQFALASGIAVAAAALGSMLVGLVATLWVHSPQVRTNYVFDPLVPVLTALILIAFLAATWAVQYIRRRRVESIPVGAAGLCLAVGFATMARPPLVATHIEPPAWVANATLQLPADAPTWGSQSRGASWWRGDTKAPAILRARLVIPELPAGWFARAALSEASAAVDGRTFTCEGPLYTAAIALSRGGLPVSAAEQVALREALDVDRMLNLRTYGAEHAVLFVTPEADVARLASRRGTYRGRFRMDLMHVEAVAALPLVRGATFKAGAYRLTIDDVQLDGPLTIRVRQSNAATMFPRSGHPSYAFHLRNRRHGEALGGYTLSQRARFLFPPVAGIVEMANATPGVTISADSLTFRGSFSQAELSSFLTPAWLEDAELVVVRTTNAGTVERLLQIDDFHWPAPHKD
jgi:hypothetical protein